MRGRIASNLELQELNKNENVKHIGVSYFKHPLWRTDKEPFSMHVVLDHERGSSHDRVRSRARRW